MRPRLYVGGWIGGLMITDFLMMVKNPVWWASMAILFLGVIAMPDGPWYREVLAIILIGLGTKWSLDERRQ